MKRLVTYHDVDFAFRSEAFLQASHRKGERRSAVLSGDTLLML